MLDTNECIMTACHVCNEGGHISGRYACPDIRDVYHMQLDGGNKTHMDKEY